MQLMCNETQMGNSNCASGSKDGLLSISAQEFVLKNSLTFMSNHDKKRKFILIGTAICYHSYENGKEFKLK